MITSMTLFRKYNDGKNENHVTLLMLFANRNRSEAETTVISRVTLLSLFS